MIEEPVDRLNYYNGQRLEASDLKLEQEYHIRVRRWLNKSLYASGIASGLDVRADGKTRFVIVGPGLALDANGREILLVEEEHICVPGSSPATGSLANPQGLYLTIRYDEKLFQNEKGQCVPQSKNDKNGNHAAWGGPALLRAKPLFNWSDALPYDSSGEVVLAQVALDSTCTYAIVNPGVRRYVGDASNAKVRQYALEGEKNIDKDNPGEIYFHVRGRQPKAVTLYLRAAPFSSLYYTELGNHTHALSSVGGSLGPPDKVETAVEHGVGVDPEDALKPAPARHEHRTLLATYFGNTAVTDNAIVLGDARNGVGPGGFELFGNKIGRFGQGDLLSHVSTHSKDFGNPDFKAKVTDPTDHAHNHDHTHQFTFLPGSSGIDPAGVSDMVARSGTTVKALSYVDDLRVKIDTHDVTKDIVNQLRNADPKWSSSNSQDKLGNGLKSHPLIEDTQGDLNGHGGTGQIKLDFLPGISFLEGEHLIELSVSGDGNGGRILYNLYVE